MPARSKSLLQKQRDFFKYNPLARTPRKPPSLLWRWHTRLRTCIEHFTLSLFGHERQHRGPRAPLHDLFQRKDQAYFLLETGKLRLTTSPPMFHHDLLEAASKVGILEDRIGYKFKDKMHGIHALKVSTITSPLYYNGTIYPVDRNNRLALLGDRVLSLAVCEMWFRTEHSNKEHSDMSSDTVSRKALRATGNAIGLEDCMLVHQVEKTIKDQVAETFEAVIGAIYIDSGYSLDVVKDIVRRTGLGDHRYLMTRKEYAELMQGRVVENDAGNGAGESPSIGPQIQEQRDRLNLPEKILVDGMQQEHERAELDLKSGSPTVAAVEEELLMDEQNSTTSQQNATVTDRGLNPANFWPTASTTTLIEQNIAPPTPSTTLIEQNIAPPTPSTTVRSVPQPKEPTESEILQMIKDQRSQDREKAMLRAKKLQSKLLNRGVKAELSQLFQQIRRAMGAENEKRLKVARASQRAAQKARKYEASLVRSGVKESKDIASSKQGDDKLDGHLVYEPLDTTLANFDAEKGDPFMEKERGAQTAETQLLPDNLVAETQVDLLIGHMLKDNHATCSEQKPRA